eukprot:CAMPEP_0168174692 /NCGR_PEP_ID=MMETSP0139_2-20121125/6665_1 /TAXON_ID=44445 /ORGANISM="Pseudo-nitzschia australis, Strain 10249 10 AB" /LENGTH=418 /DNA_ID=CAMNT_0008092911 /DNA_START=121 /DNA_END=1377 /DNA_ORIENTATION=-
MGLQLISIVFPMPGIIRTDAFVVSNGNNNFHRCRMETIKRRYQQQYEYEYYQQIYRYHPFSALLLSSKETDATDDVGSSSFSTNASNTNINSDTNMTIATTSFVSASGSGSKKEERKRYDAELEEAFAQQTREMNPLLGVKSIGVDYGLVRTGVAVTIGYNPEALDVIVTDHPILTDDEAEKMSEEEVEKEQERRLEIQRSKVTERVIELARRENADRIVVGLPLHKNGTEAHQSGLARKLACDHLALAVLRTLGPGVSVYMCDERYSSKEAAARIRSHSSQSGRGNTGDLYGLLDAESAKIILEQYYDDRLQRYNTCHSNSDGDSNGDLNFVDPTYNGELVTIQDPKLIEKLTLEYKERQRLEREKLAEERSDREARAKWRKLAMEKERLRVEEQRKIDAANGITTSKKKKKKRKRK